MTIWTSSINKMNYGYMQEDMVGIMIRKEDTVENMVKNGKRITL